MYVVNENGEDVELPEGVDRYDTSYYLRRNIFGIGDMRAALVNAGMAYSARGFRPDDWPDMPGSWSDGVHWDAENDAPISDEAREFQAASSRRLRDTYDERPGIPVHKFSSNDGWWVTKAECASALKLWEAAGEPFLGYEDAESDDVIHFLRTAAEHGGFRVF